MIFVLNDKRERACMGTKLCSALHLSEKSSKYIACFHTRDFTTVFKANLNSVSKINRDCLGFTKLWPVIGPKNSRHPLIQLVAKLKPTDDLVTRVSPRLFTI